MSIIAWRGTDSKEDTLKQYRSYIEDKVLVGGSFGEVSGNLYVACVIGCLTGRDNHIMYESLYGIPVGLAHVHEYIFEDLFATNESLGKEWSYEFLDVIKEDSDLNLVKNQLILWILDNPDYGLLNHPISDEFKSITGEVINLHKRVIGGEIISAEEWDITLKKTWKSKQIGPYDRPAIETLRLSAAYLIPDNAGVLIYQMASYLERKNIIPWNEYSSIVSKKVLDLLANAPLVTR